MPAVTNRYAALILPDAVGLDPMPYLDAAMAVIAQGDTAPDTGPHVIREKTMVCGDTICLQIEPQEDSDYGPRILITATAPPNARFSEERAARLLSDTVLAALEVCDADIVEWFSPQTLMDADDFIRLRSYVSRRRAIDPSAIFEQNPDEIDARAGRKSKSDNELAALFREPLPDGVDLEPPSQLTDRLLARCETLRNSDPAELRMRAAEWAMTGTVACISPPMGASLTVLGMARGLDFRRVTQALILTAFFVVLQNQGLIAKVRDALLQ